MRQNCRIPWKINQLADMDLAHFKFQKCPDVTLSFLVFSHSTCLEGSWSCTEKDCTQICEADMNWNEWADCASTCSNMHVSCPDSSCRTQVWNNTENFRVFLKTDKWFLLQLVLCTFLVNANNSKYIFLKGCTCPSNKVLDESINQCVLPYECPCHFKGQQIQEGQSMWDGCNYW